MEKEFVPYTLALRLKSLGFNIPTEYSWVVNVKYPEGIIGHSAPAFNHNKTEKHVSAPLFQQAFRWFREKYNVHSSPKKYDETRWWVEWGTWTSSIFETFEEAEKCWLEKLLSITEAY